MKKLESIRGNVKIGLWKYISFMLLRYGHTVQCAIKYKNITQHLLTLIKQFFDLL